MLSKLHTVLSQNYARPILQSTIECTFEQAITVLSHAGICMSYTSTWTYLQKLTHEAKYTEQVQSGHWMWVYDNLNRHQTVRHEREGKLL